MHCEKLCEKNLLVLVSCKGPQWLELQKNAISKCKLKLLEALQQSHWKTKMFFKIERLNPYNEKYLVETIGYKL